MNKARRTKLRKIEREVTKVVEKINESDYSELEVLKRNSQILRAVIEEEEEAIANLPFGLDSTDRAMKAEDDLGLITETADAIDDLIEYIEEEDYSSAKDKAQELEDDYLFNLFC